MSADIFCAWCLEKLGEKEGWGAGRIRICDNCFLHHFPDIYQKLMGIFRGYFAPPVPKKGRSKHICENRSNQILGGEK